MESETWKPVPGFEGYTISSHGRLKSLSFKRSGKPGIIHPSKVRGYPSVSLYIQGKRYKRTIHRLVASAFINEVEGHHCVNHIDGNKENNHVDNLEYVSHLLNERHKIEVLGLGNEGSKNGMAKLSERDVFLIKRMIILGISLKNISATFEVSGSCISDINRGKNWRKHGKIED